MDARSPKNSLQVLKPQAPDVWHSDPSRLSFSEYRERCLWGAPDPNGRRRCLDLRLAIQPFPYTVRETYNHFRNGEDPDYGSWLKAVESGRSYMVGASAPLARYVHTHSSSLTTWQSHAFQWCCANPSRCLVFTSRVPRRIYEIRKRGEYVEIVLPHYDAGGEKLWITRDGKRKLLIVVD